MVKLMICEAKMRKNQGSESHIDELKNHTSHAYYALWSLSLSLTHTHTKKKHKQKYGGIGVYLQVQVPSSMALVEETVGRFEFA